MVQWTPGRIWAARLVALAADAIQLGAWPLFAPGVLAPWNDVLDVGVALAMVALLGWHWAFLPTMVSEAVPLLDLIPTWTAAVLLVTRGGAEVIPPPGVPPLPGPGGPSLPPGGELVVRRPDEPPRS